MSSRLVRLEDAQSLAEHPFTKHNIVPFGWCEDNNRAIPSNEGIFTKVQTEEQRNFLLEKLNNKYTLHLRGKYV